MEQKKNRKFIVWGAVLVLLLAIGGTAVLAQSQDNPTVTPPTDEGSAETTTPALPNPFSRGNGHARPNFDDGGRGFPGHDDDTAVGEDLAAALGITVEELQAAQEAVNAAALEQAVADGLITQEQADQMAQFGGRAMRGGHFGAFGDNEELLANELGVTVEALQAAQEEVNAARLAQMVEDGVLTQEQADLMAARRAVQSHMDYEGLNAAAQAAYETAVQAALDAGEITQAQADQLLSDAAAGPGMGRFDGDFGGRGGHGGRGHSGHGFPGVMPGASTTTTDNNA
jgi:hypothetical protein